MKHSLIYCVTVIYTTYHLICIVYMYNYNNMLLFMYFILYDIYNTCTSEIIAEVFYLPMVSLEGCGGQLE